MLLFMPTKKLISLVTPFYNEEDGIAKFHSASLTLIESLPEYDFEVLCVDDGSNDSTLSLLLEVTECDSRYRVLELSRNFGKEASLTAGIDQANGEAVIPIDADLQDPVELIPRMIMKWEEGYEVVLARRSCRKSDTFLKRKTAELFYCIHNKLSSIKIPDNVGDFRLMDRKVVDALKRLPENHRFMKGLFAWVGFKSVTLDYARNERSFGESKFSGWKLWNFALEGITSFSSAPLKIWTYFGSLGAFLTAVYALFAILKTLIMGIDVPGYASLLVAILFFGSIQLIGIGILGEYIGRIFSETKRRPTYIIRASYIQGKSV
jgi:glycosyltransferase involved in cell wall biosynthesis